MADQPPTATAPSVKGEDRLEEIARIIDPLAFQLREELDRTAQLGPHDCHPPAKLVEEATAACQVKLDAARAKARQIAALPCKGGVAVNVAAERAAFEDHFITTGGGMFALEAAWKAWLASAQGGGWRLAAPSTKPDRESADEGALTELAGHTNWELSFGYPDEEAEGEWQVHRVNGGVNDREWTLIGSGQTPAAAILSARSKDTEASAGEQQ